MLKTVIVAAAAITTAAAASEVAVTSSNRQVSIGVLATSDAGCFDQYGEQRGTSSEGAFDELLLNIAECGSAPLADATALATQDSIVSETFLQATGAVSATASAPCFEDPRTQEFLTSTADAVAETFYSVHFTVLAPVEMTWEVTLETTGAGKVLFAIDGTDDTIVCEDGTDGPFHQGVIVLPADSYILYVDAEALVFASDCEIGLTGSASFDGVVTIKTPAGCPSDIDGDGVTGFLDLLALLTAWGPCVDCAEDIDQDGIVGFDDLLTVLAGWGACP